MIDPLNAFVAVFRRDGAEAGPLSGLSFAVKDVIDVAGTITGAGNPAWAASHAPAKADAAVVATLLEAGATLLGKTHTDELAFSLMGANQHYGAPINPAASSRLPGGSSSGSAAAVAGGLVDFAIGTDTAGSVRLPASYCGIYGFRPSHGRLDARGVAPLAESFDTIGFFARDAETLQAVGAALGIATMPPTALKIWLPADLWAFAEPATLAALAPAALALQSQFGPAMRAPLAGRETLIRWRETLRTIQAAEAWAAHGAWITSHVPNFEPGVAARFAFGQTLNADQVSAARAELGSIRADLARRLGEATVIAIPTTPGPAPARDATTAEQDEIRANALLLLCAASIGGLPQLSIPGGLANQAPVGLSLIAGPGQDGLLLALADVFSR